MNNFPNITYRCITHYTSNLNTFTILFSILIAIPSIFWLCIYITNSS
nr:MAG TPA: hypothetical protein [Caudoviricetes sp.]